MSRLLLLNDPQFRIPIATWTYDSLGQLRQINEFINVDDDIHQLITKYEYDVLGEKILERLPDPDGADTLGYLDTWYGYDKAGNLTAVTDPNAMLGSDPTTQKRHDAVEDNFHTTTTFYDGANRKVDQFDADPDGVATTEHDVPETTWGYDAVGNVKTQKDPAGNVVNYDYDELNRVTLEATNAYTTTLGTAQSVSRSYAYNDQGDVKKLTDRNGRVTEYSFDDLDRLKQESWRDSAGGAITRTFDYTYDDEGRRLTATDSDSTAPDFLYDYYVTGWPKSIKQTGGGFADITQTMSYDPAGNRTGLSTYVTGGRTLDTLYGSDLLGRTTSTGMWYGSGEQNHVEVDLDLLGNKTALRRYSWWTSPGSPPMADVTSTYDYDDARRLKTLKHDFATLWISDIVYDYTRDAAGWITHIDYANPNVTNNTPSTDYAHDDNGQITSASRNSYSYDLNGNRTMGGYVTGADNRLAKDGTFTYSYDNEGNRTARFPAPVIWNNSTQTYDPQSWSADSSKNTATTYRYDHHNHLTGVISRSIDFNGNVTTTSDTINRYDADDRRSESGQRNSDSGDYGLTRYGYDDRTPLLIDHPNSPAASTDYSNFMLAPDGTIVGRYHTWPGDVHAWFLNDDQDTVRDSYSNGGAYHHDFDAFGAGDQVDSFGIGYANGLTDLTTKLIHLGARDYDPGTGTWVQQDPIGYAGGDANLSRYVTPTRLPRSLLAKLLYNTSCLAVQRRRSAGAWPSPHRLFCGRVAKVAWGEAGVGAKPAAEVGGVAEAALSGDLGDLLGGVLEQGLGLL